MGRAVTSGPRGAAGPGLPFRLIVLVGFMASGKTSVGSRLAERLGWEFVDADEEVEARTGRSVEALFRERGESGFREVEGRVTAELLAGHRRVVATGGGWPAAVEGRLDALPPDVLSVWLRVPAETAVERAAREARSRPLLAVDDPTARARALLEERNPAYARAWVHLDASRASPDALVAAIVEYASAAKEPTG